MDEKLKTSWERVLHPETLKTNIITASIFCIAFEMLKISIIEKIEGFYINGFDENGLIISEEYKDKVLSLNRSPLYASLKWLQNRGAIDNKDFSKFEHIKNCRNILTHEVFKFASSGADFEVAEVFSEMIELLRKIDIWWFKNFEMEIDPETYPESLDLEQVTSGSIWSIQMLIDVALGSEEDARKYYDQLVASENKP